MLLQLLGLAQPKFRRGTKSRGSVLLHSSGSTASTAVTSCKRSPPATPHTQPHPPLTQPLRRVLSNRAVWRKPQTNACTVRSTSERPRAAVFVMRPRRVGVGWPGGSPEVVGRDGRFGDAELCGVIRGGLRWSGGRGAATRRLRRCAAPRRSGCRRAR